MSLLTSLVSAWELNEASGNAADSNSSNTLTDNNAVGSGTGVVYGTARQFNKASTQYLSHADNTDLSTGDIDFTWEAWFQIASTSTDKVIVGKDTNTGRDYTLTVSGNTLQWYLNGGGMIVQIGGLSTGVWYQTIAWHDSVADEVSVSLNNGSLTTASTGGTAPNDTGTEFNIGARRYPGFEDYFDGLIGPVRFWKRTLTGPERTQLYNSGAGLAYASFGGGGSVKHWWNYATQQLIGIPGVAA